MFIRRSSNDNSSYLSALIEKIRSFRGLTRKSCLKTILTIFEDDKFEDAGVIDQGSLKIVVSCDGIIEPIVNRNPKLAGFLTVLVNVNDVIARGGVPVGLVNIISSSSEEIREKIARGIKEGVKKYGLKILKGHTHPDTSYNAVDGAVIGLAKKTISSTGAQAQDSLIMAIDLEGKFSSKQWIKAFDSVSSARTSTIKRKLGSITTLIEKDLVSSVKDISGPGIIGSITMLCESSRKGAEIGLDSIPRPPNVELDDWVLTYPAIGFIISTKHELEVLSILRKRGLAAEAIGKIKQEKKIYLKLGGSRQLFMDLRRESIFSGLE